MSNNGPTWVVVKFGGTSVSSEPNWRSIASTVRARLADGHRVLVVHSALSGVTDRLEKLLAAALSGRHEAPLAELEQRHYELGVALGLRSEEHTSELQSH